MSKASVFRLLCRLAPCLSAVLLVSTAQARVDCVGVPSTTKVGEYGAQEAYLIVRIGSRDYRLGGSSDERAKARLALATAALVAGKQLRLRFYEEPDCGTAAVNRVVPNSVQLVR